MEWYDIETNGEHTVKFMDLPYVPVVSPTITHSPDGEEEHTAIGKKLGGIIRQGEWAWLARNSMLQIVSLRGGQTISTYEFCESRGYDSCYIKCVEEIFPNNPEIMLLAVVLESFRAPGGGGSYVVIFSVELCNVLSTIDLSLHITCARFMSATACNRTLMQNFDGCLACGSEEGVVVLLDLNIRKLLAIEGELEDAAFVPCHIVDYSMPLIELHRNFRQCQQDGIHFGLQMEVIESPCSIQCLQAIDLVMGLAVGLEDGRLALYDLAELQIFYIGLPKSDIAMSPLVKMDYLEPPDDPRPCLYLWTLHENGENLHAVMHNLMYEKRVLDETEEYPGRYYFESFQTCAARLQLPLEATKSEVLACQAISTLSTHGEDDSNCLCAISWFSILEHKNKLIIFDLNQWYKEEMPSVLEYGKQPNYLAGYILNGEVCGLHTQLQPNSITHFNSIQRFEEHFYPNSLSFDCALLHTDGCRSYSWLGAQNRLINLLRVSNASIFLEPNNCFNEILRTRLMPQFNELNLNSTYSKSAKYEIMLSCALEHNCISLLRDCARSWIDGSFMGNFAVSTGLSLSTLTDWIWKRATDIKTRCNDLCKGLFEFGGYPLDHREQKELGFITRQLKLLADLLGDILTLAKKQVADKVYSSLSNNYNSLRMASNYQDILLWLLNIGLLPEASPYTAGQMNASHDLVPYPYKELKEMYKKKRSFFAKINDNFISKKSGSCRLLYIDAFIDHACKGNVLHEFWLENDGDGLYPPNSIEAMLRVLLVPDLDFNDKYAILLYFFLDLNMAIDEQAYKGVVSNFIKFPSVFKLSAALIKTVQSFWNLDHDQFLPAVDEFISPFNKNQTYPQWLVELLIEALLTQNSANLALRILESQPSLISPMLKLKTLLANELVSEAFHFVRSKHDDDLLEIFFNCCLRNGQFGVIRDLALSENEGKILQNILKRSQAPGAESLHFVYLLQKSKYIEAVSYMDELSSKPKTLRSSALHHPAHMETPNMVLSAFNTTMTPVTQGLTDVYFRIKNKLKKKDVDNRSPVPLSCQLIKQNANSLLGGIYHSSALSAHFATYYWGELEGDQPRNETKHLLSSNNAPFLRRPQNETNYVDYLGKNNLSYPQAYKVTEKRNLIESELLDNADEQLERQKLENQLNPKKKRRLIGQEIVDDLQHFMKMNKQKTINLNVSDFKFKEQQHEVPKTHEHESLTSMELLTRPLITKTFAPYAEDVHEEQPEIQGILKPTNSEHGSTTQEEEKNLRFRLPSTDLSNSLIQRRSEESDEHMELEEQLKPQQSVSLREGLIRAKHVSRSVSEESNKSSVSSSNASEENFYSPLSSRNNSRLDSSTLSRCSILSGPKARKPIARLSAEPETPTEVRPLSRQSAERETQTKAQSSMRLSSVKLLGEDESKESLKEEPLPKQVKPLFEEKLYFSGKPAVVVTQESTVVIDDNQRTNNESSSKHYVTTFGSSGSSISGRKALTGIATTIEKAEDISVPGNSKSAYVTAFETLTNVTPSFKSNFEFTQTSSSGFGSISGRSTSTGSKIGEFVPKISSSKVGCIYVKTDSKKETKPASPTKLSECSTVLGSITTLDYTNSSGNNVFAMPSIPMERTKDHVKHTEEQKRHMLETTLGMSSYDFSILDSTSLQQTKSSLMVTAKDILEKEDTAKNADEKQIEKLEFVTSPDEEEQMEGVEEEEHEKVLEADSKKEKQNELQSKQEDIQVDTKNEVLQTKDTALKEVKDQTEVACSNKAIESVLQNVTESSFTPSPKRVTPDLLHSADEDDCIVLSSSSSYIDDNDYGRAFDFDRESAEDVEPYHTKVDSGNSFETDDDYEEEDEDVDNEDMDEDEDENDVEENDDDVEDEVESEASAQPSEDIGGIVVELTDDSSVDTRSNLHEESSSEDVKTYDDKSSSSAAGGENEEQVVSTTTNTSETVSSVGEANIEFTLLEKEDEVSSTIDATTSGAAALQVNETVTTSTSVISTEPTKLSSSIPQEENKDNDANESNKTDLENQSSLQDNTNQKPEIEDIETTKEELNTEETSLSKKELAVESNIDEELKDKASEEPSISSEPIEEEQITLRMEEGDSMDPLDSLEEKTKQKQDAETKEDISKSATDLEANVTTNTLTDKPKRLRTTSNSSKLLEEEIKSTASPRRNTRSTSIPPIDLDTTALPSPRRNTRGGSVPRLDVDPKAVISPRRTTRGTSVPPEDISVKTVASRNVRGASVPKMDVEVVSTPRRRNTRGISLPPQTITETEEEVVTTPSRKRSLRASSLQPKYNLEEETLESSAAKEDTPSKKEKLDEAESRSTRGTSVPAGGLTGKVSTRRRSILLDAINEDSPAIDSPSAHTRFRSRLSSMESELDSSIVSADQPVQAKRSRRISLSGNTGELPVTPKRSRRNSINSQPETTNVLTPRSLRGRSVLAVPEDENEAIAQSPKPSESRKIATKSKGSTETLEKMDEQSEVKSQSPKEEASSTAYSTSRRLTRTQLAVMEKSAALTQSAMATEANISPNAKRSTKGRGTRSTTNASHDSDDGESISSKRSTTSSAATNTRRRTTRKSIKEDNEEDAASVASSIGSEKHHRPRRSKDNAATLSAIPEDAPVETTKKRGRPPTKH